ncbi:MAG: ABC transporter ATP-binding protein [Ilumatobacteraceae bacterium]
MSERSERINVTASPVLAVHDLRVTFQQRGVRTHAVRGVSFEVAAGQALGIVGESGSGKSVTVRTVMGLFSGGAVKVEGSIRLAGTEVVGLGESGMRVLRRGTVSMVFQDPMRSLNPTMTIGAQLAETLRLRPEHGSSAAVKAAACELLELVQMPAPKERLKAYPHQLSGGMRQRVVIAMALASRPALLIADEPTTALDVTIQAQILDLLDELRRDLGMALILITHDLSVAAERCDEIAVMYAGQIVEKGSAAQLTSAMRMPYTRALFASTPGPHVARHSLLPAIPGRPPLLQELPTACPFAPRCQHRTTLDPINQSRCDGAEPTDELVDGRRVRCWFPLEDQLLGTAASHTEGSLR